MCNFVSFYSRNRLGYIVITSDSLSLGEMVKLFASFVISLLMAPRSGRRATFSSTDLINGGFILAHSS